MEVYQFKNLFEKVNVITTNYGKLIESSGENFNIFKILKLHSSEVRLHSAFIAELLNPQGSHGQKDVFLKLFIDKFQFKNNEFYTQGVTVEIEKHFGFLNEGSSEGGRIDIILTDKNWNQIVIENKINAGDQKNQLLRYNQISPNADLFYLTLLGVEPQDYSKGTLQANVDFKCLSYKLDIINWLEDCRKVAINSSILYQTITQYINITKQLTNQTMNDSMTEDLAQLVISSLDNVDATFSLLNNIETIKQKLLLNFNIELEELAIKLNIKCEATFDFKNKYNGVFFYKDNWKFASIGFQFQNYSNGLIFGIVVDNPETFPIESRSQLDLIKSPNSNSTDWWPIYFDFESPYYNWNNSKDLWTSVFTGSIINKFEYKLKDLLNLIELNKIEL